MDYEDRRKLELIDEALTVLSVEDIKDILGQELVVSKLKNKDKKNNLNILGMYDKLESIENKIISMESSMWSMKNDLQTLVRSVDISRTADFINLKSRLGVY